MSDRDVDLGSLPNRFDQDVSRRDALKALAGGGVLLGAGKTADNVLLGYGVLAGTNLVEQNLASRVRERFGPSPNTFSVSGHEIAVQAGEITVRKDGGEVAAVSVADTDPERAAMLDSQLGLEGDPLTELVRDLGAIERGDVRFAFSQYPAFFDRVLGAETRPNSVGVLRGNTFEAIEPETIERFAGVDPADTEALVTGVSSGFREHSGYNTPQYIAGSIEDNVLFDTLDLRQYFRSDTDFESILSDEETTGLLCYDFAYRSIEAFHAVKPRRQTVPVLGAVVTDARHKHVYTGLASVIREDGELVVPMTFVDYMHSTLADDFAVRGLVGEAIKAYDRRHRTDGVYWNRYARW